MRLSLKIPMIISLVAVPAIVAAFVFGYGLIRRAISEPSEQFQLISTRQTLMSLDASLNERFKDVKVLAKAPVLINSVDSPNQQNINATKQRLEEIRVEHQWRNFGIFKLNGDIIISDNSSNEIKLNQKGLAQLAEVKQGGAIYSDVFLDSKDNQPTMFFAAPVGDDATKGVLIGFLDWKTVTQTALKPYIEQVSLELYNADGLIIAKSDGQTEGLLNVPPREGQAIEAAKRGESATFIEKTNQGEEWLVATAVEQPIGDYSGNRWVLMASIPTKLAFSTANNVAIGTITTLSLMSLVMVVLISLLINRLFKPLVTMTETANKLALGDLTQRVIIKQRNEIGQLGLAFNNMAEKLQLIYRDLENRVKEKTALLGQKVDELSVEKANDEALLSSIGEGMVAVGADGRIAKINDLAIDLLGLDPRKAHGLSVYDNLQFFTEKDELIKIEDWPPIVALKTVRKAEMVVTLHKANQRKTQVSILATPVKQNGKALGTIIVVRDVTKEREVDRMKTEFISLASHQLRTPLSAIKWFSEMLMSGDAGKLSREQTEFSKHIYDSTERMIDLVNSLLNISRIESGRIIIDPKPTDLKELVNGIVNDLKVKIEQRQQNLVVSVHSGLEKINVDPRLVGQVYLNFLTNSIKYTPKGGEISVFISRKGDEIVSQIADNGYGIPKAQQGNLFKKFFRAENIVKIETDGTGLGLYLVKAIIDSSGGRVWFKSEEGKGSTFWFSLPASGMKARAGEVTLDV